MFKLFNISLEKTVSPKIEPEQFVYHVSNKLHDDIRSLKFQKGIDVKKYIGTKEYLKNYFRQVNTFAAPISTSNIELLQKKGFKQWNQKELYVYKIDLRENLHSIENISVTSSPEQKIFDDKNWETWFEIHKDLEDKDWFREKKLYLERREEFLNSNGIKTTMSVEECIVFLKTRDWKDMDKYVIINSREGNKKQYASYIPHIQILTKGPLSYVSVEKVK